MPLDPTLLVRRLTDEPDDTTYTDTEIATRLADAAGDSNTVVRDIWAEKMAAAASFVDTSEGGSSRKMSDAYTHAKEMFDLYDALVNETSGRVVLRRITRV